MTTIDLKPMKMTDLSLTSAEQYLSNPDWVLEQKMDGARALIHAEVDRQNGGYAFRWLASGGGPMKFAAAVMHLPVIEAELTRVLARQRVLEAWIDGELMPDDGTLRVFDLPYLFVSAGDPEANDFEVCTPANVYAYRLQTRNELFSKIFLERISTVRTAMRESEKRTMWAQINDAGVEGGMLKHLGGEYEGGVRTKTQLKLKLVKSADVVVTKTERKFDHKGMVTHGSADLAIAIDPRTDPKPWASEVTGKRISNDDRAKMLSGTKSMMARAMAFSYVPRKLLPIGAASLIGKDLTIEEGDVVEVNYLYWTGDALVQPRIMRKRLAEEKLADHCTIDQLPVYTKRMV